MDQDLLSQQRLGELLAFDVREGHHDHVAGQPRAHEVAAGHGGGHCEAVGAARARLSGAVGLLRAALPARGGSGRAGAQEGQKVQDNLGSQAPATSPCRARPGPIQPELLLPVTTQSIRPKFRVQRRKLNAMYGVPISP
jgi:hypothetical protein